MTVNVTENTHQDYLYINNLKYSQHYSNILLLDCPYE